MTELPAEEYVGPAVVSGPGVSRLAGARTSTTEVSTHQLVEVRGAPATSLETSDSGLAVDVTLRGHFEPLDGRFHWYGRIGSDAALAERARAGDTVTLTTPHGTAEGRLSDVDPWGRFRISGTRRPPF
jgi:hypothetical protein